MSHGQFYFFLANVWATLWFSPQDKVNSKWIVGITLCYLTLALCL